MDIKVLIGMLNRPWFIEPTHAMLLGDTLNQFVKSGSLPNADKRFAYTDRFGLDFGPVFRVDENGSLTQTGSVQVIRLDAPIAKYDYCGSPGTQSMTQLLAAANADDTVKSIILWIDSPGGQVDGTESFANAIKNSQKPVVAFSDGLICSAAYWIGSSASEIIVDGSNNGWNATVGSIGTMASWIDDSKALEMQGKVRHIVFADASTDKWGDYFANNSGDYTNLKTELNALNDTFLAAVKSNRGDKLQLGKENVLTGKTYNAKDALKYGLIDKIGSFDVALKRAVQMGNKKSKPAMSGKNVFQSVLAAANAQSFEVVEGGFMLTEEQLNLVEAALGPNNAIIVAQAGQIIALNNQLAATNELQEQLNAANAAKLEAEQALEAANTTISQKEEEITALNESVASLEASTKNFMRGNGKPGNDAPQNGEEGAGVKSKASHNLAADKFIGK